jgi:hypothetical protein
VRRWRRQAAERQRAAVVGHGWPRPASVGHGRPRWPATSSFYLPHCWCGAFVVAASGGWLERVGGTVVVQLRRVSSGGGVAEVSGCSLLPWSRACGEHGAKSGESLH